MITAVTLNPALDKVYFIEDFQVGEMYRVGQMVESAGGKGVNVARIVKTLGIDSTAIGFKGAWEIGLRLSLRPWCLYGVC